MFAAAFLIGAVVFAWLLSLAVSRYSVLGWVCLAVFILSASDANPVGLFSLNTIQVFPEDVLCGVLFGAALFRLRWMARGLRCGGFFVAVLIALAILNMARGFYDFGTPALVESRPFFYAMAGIAWGISIDMSDQRQARLFNVFVVATGSILCVIVILRLSQTGFVSANDYYIDANGTYRTLRPVVAAQAMVLALAAVYTMCQWPERRRFIYGLMALLFSASAIICQHRSVWAAFLFATLIAFIHSRGNARWRVFAGLLMILITGLFVALVSSSGFVHALQGSLKTSHGAGSTLSDRTGGWSLLVEQVLQRDDGSVLWGLPFGFGYDRIGPNGLLETYQPHNFYVQIFLRLGALGLVAWLALCALLLRRIWSRPHPVWAVPVMVSVLVFILAYGLTSYVAVFIGLAAAAEGAASNDRNDGSRVDSRLSKGHSVLSRWP